MTCVFCNLKAVFFTCHCIQMLYYMYMDVSIPCWEIGFTENILIGL